MNRITEQFSADKPLDASRELKPDYYGSRGATHGSPKNNNFVLGAGNGGRTTELSRQSFREDHLHRMHIEIDNRTRKLEQERRTVHDLDHHIEEARSELEFKYKKAGEEGKSCKTVDRNADKYLENLLQRLNLINMDDQKLVENINKARRERGQVDEIFKSLKADIKTATSKCLQQHKVVEDIKVGL